MRVSIAQLSSSEDKRENLDKAKKYIKKAKEKGADIVVLPELYMVYTSEDLGTKPSDFAEPLDGPFVTGLSEAAKESGVHVICGIFESTPEEENRAYNTTVTIDDSGKLLNAYRKTHLYDAFNHKESDEIIPGIDQSPVVETKFGRLGIMVCYELRFPEISRSLALKDADYIVVPSGWVEGYMKEEHWQTLIRARAIENTSHVIASNQVGTIFTGRSMIVDPMGVTLGDAGEEETLLVRDICDERTEQVRKKLPSVKDRKPELYSN